MCSLHKRRVIYWESRLSEYYSMPAGDVFLMFGKESSICFPAKT
ncbi:hypothetical protein Deipr_1658 [Deinococcus proteolyticus MRP]|uniref:Uncharacterized protein n=1 Tax=Deinococcus proteolyticus (strain ATCC 35074 / DSM 20540 / JCM 6276 / NBRC 101906 / NCIMB 13154 / VKM Ac-1939 / CCM 2703 / MRP) TaxID=693977 RepID=F0RKT0_DEIPM|nr:hypothetical protein Deipr_1658 [Deinococcus proteolyticus MRP]